MKARFTALKGAPDVLPPETHLWSKIENAACEVFCAYGYDEIKTPILEPAELFLRSIGSSSDIVAKEMYSFTDNPLVYCENPVQYSGNGRDEIADEYVHLALF